MVDRLMCLCYHWPSIIMRHIFLCHNCFRRCHTFLCPYSFEFCFGVLPATKVALRRWLSSSLGATWVLFIMTTRARENGRSARVPLLSLALYHHETHFFVSQLFQVLTHFSVSILLDTDFRVTDISAADTLFCVPTIFVTHSCCSSNNQFRYNTDMPRHPPKKATPVDDNTSNELEEDSSTHPTVLPLSIPTGGGTPSMAER